MLLLIIDSLCISKLKPQIKEGKFSEFNAIILYLGFDINLKLEKRFGWFLVNVFRLKIRYFQSFQSNVL